MIFKNVSVVCEGPTEVDFVKKLNHEYFNQRFISLKPVNGPMQGSVSIDRLLFFIKQANEDIVTTFVDFYGFKGNTNKTCLQLEDELKGRVEKDTFIPYVQLHETEALWFSDIESIKLEKHANQEQQRALDSIVEKYKSSEDINNSRETAPSKRLERIFTDYAKILDGQAISQRISVELMKEKCPHFSEWLDSIENLANRLR